MRFKLLVLHNKANLILSPSWMELVILDIISWVSTRQKPIKSLQHNTIEQCLKKTGTELKIISKSATHALRGMFHWPVIFIAAEPNETHGSSRLRQGLYRGKNQ